MGPWVRSAPILMAFLSIMACKLRDPDSSEVREDAASGPGANEVKPYASLQFGSGAALVASCVSDGSAKWSPVSRENVPDFGLVLPGVTQVSRADFAVAANPDWTREVHPLNGAISVWATNADSIPLLLERLAPLDPNAGRWQYLRGLGVALKTAITRDEFAKSGNRYGIVALRRFASYQTPDKEAGPSTWTKDQAGYQRCGDGYVSGRLVTDTLTVFIAAPTAASREAAVRALTSVAASKDLEKNLKALDDQAKLGASFRLVTAPGAGNADFQVTPPEVLESLINQWVEGDGTKGVRSELLVGEPFEPGAAPSPETTAVNAALQQYLPTIVASLTALPEDKAVVERATTDLSTGIEACGGRRYDPSCTDLSALAANTMTAARRATLPATYQFEGDANGKKWCLATQYNSSAAQSLLGPCSPSEPHAKFTYNAEKKALLSAGAKCLYIVDRDRKDMAEGRNDNKIVDNMDNCETLDKSHEMDIVTTGDKVQISPTGLPQFCLGFTASCTDPKGCSMYYTKPCGQPNQLLKKIRIDP